MVALQCSCLRDLSSIHSRHVTLVLGLHLQCCGLEYCGLGLSCFRTLVQSVLYRQSEESASTLTLTLTPTLTLTLTPTLSLTLTLTLKLTLY